MAGRMEAHADFAEPQGFTVGDGLGAAGEVLAVAQAHQVEGFARGEHRAMTRAGVIGVSMGDEGARNRPHRVDMKVAGLAAQPFRLPGENILRAHLRYIGRQPVALEGLPSLPSCRPACSCPPAT
jgi:hypothetical protein